MKIILTNDGVMILNIDNKVIHANSTQEALDIMWGHYGPRNQISKDELRDQIRCGMFTARSNNDTVLRFGVLGYFLFSDKEDCDV